MEDCQIWEVTSNGNGYGDGNGCGNGNGYGNGRGNGDGDGYGRGSGSGSGNGDIYLHRLFPISSKYHYLLEGQTLPQRVKICYDLYNASSQEAFDVLVEWYETVQDLDKAK